MFDCLVVRLGTVAAVLLVAGSVFAWEGPKRTVDPEAAPVRRTWADVRASIAASIAKTGEGYFRYSQKYNDLGPIDTSGTLTAEELKTQFAMACVLASPITVRGPAPAAVKTWLKDFWLMNVNDDKVGRQGHVVAESNGALVVKKYLWGMNNDHCAVAFYNPTDLARSVDVTSRDLEFSGTVKWTDRFDAARSGSFESAMSVEVPAHGTSLYYMNGTPALRENYRIECATRLPDRPGLVWDCVYVPTTEDYGMEVVSSSDKRVAVVVNGLCVGMLARGNPVKVRLEASENRVVLSGEGLADVRGLRISAAESCTAQ